MNVSTLVWEDQKEESKTYQDEKKTEDQIRGKRQIFERDPLESTSELKLIIDIRLLRVQKDQV